jgi:hypothetical protein
MKRGFSMKWVQSSVFLARSVSASLAVVTMVLAPVAQGAQAKKAAVAAGKGAPTTKWIHHPLPNIDYNYNIDKETVQKFFTITGLGKKKDLTVGEFFNKALPLLPKTLQRDLGYWAMVNRSQTMPQVQVSTYKASSGKEQIRLVFSRDSETMTLSFDPDSETKFVKVNNVDLSKRDVHFHDNAFRKLAKFDKSIRQSLLTKRSSPTAPNVVFSAPEFGRLTPRQQAMYMIQLRETVRAAQDVQKAFKGKKVAFGPQNENELYAKYFVGMDAQAADGPQVGDKCIVNGYVTIYGMTSRGGQSTLSCGGGKEARAHLQNEVKKEARVLGLTKVKSCPSGQLPCSIAGYALSNTGGRFCVEDVVPTITTGTSKACEDYSPIPSKSGNKAEEDKNKEDFIKRYMKHVLKKGDVALDIKDGAVEQGQKTEEITAMLSSLEKYVKDNTWICDNMPAKKVPDAMPDQYSACEALKRRIIDLKTYAVTTTTTTTTTTETEKCNIQNSQPDCTCGAGTNPNPQVEKHEDGSEIKYCALLVVPYKPAEPEKPAKRDCRAEGLEEDNNGDCFAAAAIVGDGIDWRIPAAGVGIAALIWLATRDKKKKPAPPAAPLPVAATPPTNPDPCTVFTSTTPVTSCLPATPTMPPPVVVAVPLLPETPATPTTPTTPVVTTPPIVIPEPVPDQPEFASNIPATTADGVRKVR